jgi:hypothetical protein
VLVDVVTAAEVADVVVAIAVVPVVVVVEDVVWVVVVVVVDELQDASSMAATSRTLKPNQITLFFT